MDPKFDRWDVMARGADVFQAASVIGLAAAILIGMVWAVMEPTPADPSPEGAEKDFVTDVATRARAIQVSDDGHYLDVVQGHLSLVRRDSHTGAELAHVELSTSHCGCVRLSKQGRVLATVDAENQLQVFQGTQPVGIGELPGILPEDDLVSCAVSPLGELIAVASKRGDLWILTLCGGMAESRPKVSLGDHGIYLAFSPDGDRLALVNSDRKFVIWDVQREQVVVQQADSSPEARFGAWSGDGKHLLTYGCEQHIHLWDAATGKLQIQWDASCQLVSVARLSADGRIAAIGGDRYVSLWDTAEGRQLFRLAHSEGAITDLQFSDADRTLFVSDIRGHIRRWSLADRRLVWSVN